MQAETILIIDDDPNVAELIADFCTNAGYETHILNDSTKAMETITNLKPNLITLDLEMPNVDGFEILRRIKENPETRTVPVIIVSILANEAERKGLLTNAQAILSKPINFKRLKDRVDRYIKNKYSE